MAGFVVQRAHRTEEIMVMRVGLVLAAAIMQLSCSCTELTGEGRTDGSTADYAWEHWADSAYDTWFADTAPEIPDDLVTETVDEHPFACPPSMGVVSEFVVDGEPSPTSRVDFAQPCTVTDIRYHSITEGLTLSLDCEDTIAHTLDLIPYPPLIVALAPGDEVVFYYKVAPTTEDLDVYERWLRIESLAEELIITAIDASRVFSEEAYEFLFPISCFDGGGSCDRQVTPCYDEDRTMVVFQIHDPPAPFIEVRDGRSGVVGLGPLYHIRVGEAKERTNIRCPSISNNWYRLLVSLD